MDGSFWETVRNEELAEPRLRARMAFLSWKIRCLALRGCILSFQYCSEGSISESQLQFLNRVKHWFFWWDGAKFLWCVRSLPSLHLHAPGWGGQRGPGQSLDVSDLWVLPCEWSVVPELTDDSLLPAGLFPVCRAHCLALFPKRLGS